MCVCVGVCVCQYPTLTSKNLCVNYIYQYPGNSYWKAIASKYSRKSRENAYNL